MANEQTEIFQKNFERLNNDLRLIHSLIIDKIQQGHIPNSELVRYLENEGYQGLYVYLFENGTWINRLAVSKPLLETTMFQLYSNFQKNSCQNLVYFDSPDEESGLYWIENGSQEFKEGASILIVKIDPQDYLKRNFYFSDWLNSYASLVVDGKIIATTNLNLRNRNIQLHADEFSEQDGIKFLETEDYFGSYQFFFENKTYFSIVKSIPLTPLTLTVDSSSISIEKQWSKMFWAIIFFLGGILMIGGLVVWFFSKRFKRPISKLLQVMRNVGSGDLKSKYQQTAFGFEINLLGYHFNHMVDSLKSVLEDIKNVTVKKEVLESELKLGQAVQKTLQQDILVSYKELEVETYFQPAKLVGGDFIDFYKIDKNGNSYLVIILADTSGKGVFACFYALILRSLLKMSFSVEQDFAEAIKKSNSLFCEDTRFTDAFVTAFFCWIDLKSYEMSYTSCGHLPMIKFQSPYLEELNTSGIALGVVKNIEIEVKKVQLDPHVIFVLYSDGLIDCVNAYDKQFGKEAFLKFIQEIDSKDPVKIKESILKEIALFKDSADSFDDETLIIFKRPIN